MDIQAKLYDRILVVHLQGTITVADVVAFDAAVSPNAGKVSFTVLLLDNAEFGDDVVKALLQWREQAKLIKIKIYLVRKDSKFTEIPGLVEALDLINTTESSRLVELFAKEAQFETLKARLTEADAILTKTLKAVPEVPAGDLSTVLPTLQEICSKLELEYKNLSAEINTLNKEPRVAPNQENVARVKAAKKEVIAALKTLGLY